jgi:hypothetical protein
MTYLNKPFVRIAIETALIIISARSFHINATQNQPLNPTMWKTRLRGYTLLEVRSIPNKRKMDATHLMYQSFV